MLYLLVPLISDFAGTIILLLLTTLSYRAYKLTGYKVFLAFFLGFSLLASSSFVNFLTLLLVMGRIVSKPFSVIAVASSNMLSLIVEIVAYSWIAMAYFEVHKRSKEAVLTVFPLFMMLGNLVELLLLSFITIQSIGVYFDSRKKSALIVTVSFSLLLFSQILRLMQLSLGRRHPYTPPLFILSKVLYFAALLCLLALVLEVVRTDEKEKI
ncbi:MAG TPA: hypothetical protein ENF87_00365 [Thermoproteales archaeon]|nr:hypothetical protein [Thermoproteales archaeon]